MLTDDTDEDGCQVMAKPHMTFWDDNDVNDDNDDNDVDFVLDHHS